MKKQTKRARPRHPQFKPPYSAMAVMFASTTQPLSQEQRDYQLGIMRRSLHQLQFAEHPTPDNWRDCSDAINVMDTFLGLGWCQDPDGLLQDAIDGMKRAAALAKAGKSMRLDSDGVAAMNAILDDYEACLAAISARSVMEAYNQTVEQIWAIQRGKMRDAQVVEL